MLQSSSSEKRLVKPLKNCYFGPNLHRKEVIMGHAQDGKFFLAEITKADHQLQKVFILWKYHMLWLSYKSLCDVFSVMFSVKKVPFPAKTPTQYFNVSGICLILSEDVYYSCKLHLKFLNCSESLVEMKFKTSIA